MKGRILKIQGDRAFVRVDPKAACGSNCANCGNLCGSSKRVILATNEIGAREGYIVTVENSLFRGIIGRLPKIIEVLQ